MVLGYGRRARRARLALLRPSPLGEGPGVGGQQVDPHLRDDVLRVVHFLIAESQHSESARNRGFGFQPIQLLHVRVIVNSAIEFDQQAVRQGREVVDKITDLALLAEVRAFMLQLTQNLPELLFRWRQFASQPFRAFVRARIIFAPIVAFARSPSHWLSLS